MTKKRLNNAILFHLILQDKEFISEELSESDTIVTFHGHEYYINSQFLKDIYWMANVLKQKFKAESY